MSDILGAAGQVAGAAIQADAIEDATKMQIEALEKQRQFVFDQLDPSVIGSAAARADATRALDRLRLQGIIDPELLKQRYDSQKVISNFLGTLGSGADTDVANVAASEAIRGTPGLDDIKSKLIDSAMQELNAGATLPPDVQAELVQTGLERTGQMSGSATTEGFANNILRQLIGTAALNLKAERQKRAADLAKSAQDMDVKRQSILGTLFPALTAAKTAKLGAAQNVLQQSNQMVPEAGLGGSDIANLWLARVGATNQLAQSAADAAARGAIGQAAAFNNMIGGAASGAGALLNKFV